MVSGFDLNEPASIWLLFGVFGRTYSMACHRSWKNRQNVELGLATEDGDHIRPTSTALKTR